VSMVNVRKHFPAASHEVNGPQGIPNNVKIGGRGLLRISATSSCLFPDQTALLTVIDLIR